MKFWNYNSKIINETSALISPNSRGFKFGEGVFETMKSKECKIYFAEDHCSRMLNGLTVLDIKIPNQYTTAFFTKQINALLMKNQHNQMAKVRLTMFSGDGNLFDELSDIPNYIIQTWALPDDIDQWNDNGLVLGICTDVKKSCDTLSNLKHNNFLPYVMAAKQANKNKCNDAVIINNFGRVCETTIANIFLIIDKVVFTPSLQEGCVAGIVRKNILHQLAINNVQVIEKEITIEELMNADEVFLTNSIQNIRWVQSIGNKKYNNPYTKNIYDMFISYTTI
ncbi:MAG TPA: aminotransferase class IV [Ferruginibacter sp.]|nr:aminotransferase class IV [Ferruginibacter sp.]